MKQRLCHANEAVDTSFGWSHGYGIYVKLWLRYMDVAMLWRMDKIMIWHINKVVAKAYE